jgi:conjugative transposon TraM protein
MIKEEIRSGELLQGTPARLQNRPAAFRKLKMLLVLPLLVLPFLTMAFWALGGGKNTSNGPTGAGTQQGLNLDLPSAHLKDDKNEDKLTYYEKAQKQEGKNQVGQKDSVFKLQDSVGDDNELDNVLANSPSKYTPVPKGPYTGLNTSPVHAEGYKDPTEDKIRDRLRQLEYEINKPQPTPFTTHERVNTGSETPESGSDVERMEAMMKELQEKGASDPEMAKLEGMLDKILDIQHPTRVNERLKERSLQLKTAAFPVLTTDGKANTSLLTSDTTSKRKALKNGFYGCNDSKQSEGVQNAVEAVVHQTQTIVSGSNVKLRLQNDIYVNGTLIPRGNFLSGLASLDGERLHIEVSSIRFNNSIFPVKLGVYDLDGQAGVNIPGALARDVARQSADNSVQNVELGTLSPSLAAQATAAGINTAKSLLTRKLKLVRVTIKAGYKVLLWNKDANQ